MLVPANTGIAGNLAIPAGKRVKLPRGTGAGLNGRLADPRLWVKLTGLENSTEHLPHWLVPVVTGGRYTKMMIMSYQSRYNII